MELKRKTNWLTSIQIWNEYDVDNLPRINNLRIKTKF